MIIWLNINANKRPVCYCKTFNFTVKYLILLQLHQLWSYVDKWEIFAAIDAGKWSWKLLKAHIFGFQTSRSSRHEYYTLKKQKKQMWQNLQRKSVLLGVEHQNLLPQWGRKVKIQNHNPSWMLPSTTWELKSSANWTLRASSNTNKSSLISNIELEEILEKIYFDFWRLENRGRQMWGEAIHQTEFLESKLIVPRS